MRDPDIQRLLDATAEALRIGMPPNSAAVGLSRNYFAAAASDTGRPSDGLEGEDVTVVHHLAPALVTAATGSKATANVADALSVLAPRLNWRRRMSGPNQSEGFQDNHANAVVVGQGGLEDRDDIRLGMSLMSPATRYPDHNHPPEEMYLVLSPGQWRNDETEWHEPGIGGVVHNPPAIGHAMRSANAPLLTIWCLWSP